MFSGNFSSRSWSSRTRAFLTSDDADLEIGTSTLTRHERRIPPFYIFAFTTIATLYGLHAVVSRTLPILHQHAAWQPTEDPLGQLLSLSIPSEPNPSTRWAPAVISRCDRNTPSYYAPCVAKQTHNAVYGEELIYPDFGLREPVFAKTRPEDGQAWRSLVDGIRDRAAWCSHEGWVCYRGQTGQNIVRWLRHSRSSRLTLGVVDSEKRDVHGQPTG